MSPAPSGRDAEPLRDGAALDRMTERVEAWAASYARLDDASRWDADFERKFQPLAAALAERATPPARRFQARDWALAIVLWTVISGAVFTFSVLVMRLEGAWLPVFGAVAVTIAIVGVRQSYLEVSSERRVTAKRARKEQWLLEVTRKIMRGKLRERAARRDASARGEPGARD